MSATSASISELDLAIEAVTHDVYRYARFRLDNTHDAEDATMETLHALRKESKSFLRSGSQTFFAIGVCRRKIANIVRANRFRFWPRRSSSDPTVMTDSQIVVSQILARLNPEHREVLALKYFHEFTQEEIAKLMDRTPTAVNSLLQRARQAFAELAPDRKVFE